MTDPPGPLFSVVLLVCGPEANLGGAVRSVWSQGGDDFEIIAIDDAASDGVPETLDQMALQAPVPMRVVHAAGVGRPGAWNLGSQAASGQYVAFLDADDEYHVDRFDAFRRAHLICGGFAWGFSGVQGIDARDRPMAVETIRDTLLRSAIYASTRPVEAIRNLPRMFTPVSCGNLVVDARTFRELGGFRDYPHLSGWDLSLRLLRTSDPVTIERPLYRQRIRQDTVPSGQYPTSQPGLVGQEQTTIVEEYWRGLFQDGLADGPSSPLDADARAAIAATLWGVDQLRRFPLLYKTAWWMARLARRVKRRYR